MIFDVATSGRMGKQSRKTLEIAAVVYPAVELPHPRIVDGIELSAAYATGTDNGAGNARRSF